MANFQEFAVSGGDYTFKVDQGDSLPIAVRYTAGGAQTD